MRVRTILERCPSILKIKVIESSPDDNGNSIIRYEGSVDEVIMSEVVREKVIMISCQENILKLYV